MPENKTVVCKKHGEYESVRCVSQDGRELECWSRCPECETEMPNKTVVCKEHGEYESVVFGVSRYGNEYWSACPQCEAIRAALQAKEEARRQQEAHEKRLEWAQIPQRFIGKGFDDYHASTEAQRRVLAVCREYADNFAPHLDAGRCLVLSGGIGCGKTHLANAILQQLLSHRFPPQRERYSERIGWSVLYTTASEIIRSIRATWNKRADQSEEQVLYKFTNKHLLVIDELGATMGSDSEQSQLGELLDMRYSATLPTLVISNCDRAGLIHHLGERAVDRLRDNGGLMAVLNWPSYRA